MLLLALKNSKINKERLELHLKINNNIDIEKLLLDLNHEIDFKYDYQNEQKQHHLVFYKGISKNKVEQIAYSINAEVDELLSLSPKWENDFSGILQLVQITCVQSKLTYE